MKKSELCNRKLLCMNLQFFADDSSAGADDSTPPDNGANEQNETGNEGGTDSQHVKTYEDAMAEIAKKYSTSTLSEKIQ